MKKIFLITSLGATALALAAVITIGASGQGAVTNARGEKGLFRFEGKKSSDGARIVVGGSGTFETAVRRNDQNGRLVIHLREARNVEKRGKVAVITGLGGMSVTYGNVTSQFLGTVRITVEDLRTANNQPNTVRDKYSVRFVADRQGPTFEFGGVVTEGNVLVFERNGQ